MARESKEERRLSKLNEYWRPAAAITYLVICICDFIIFPLIFGLKEQNVTQLALAVKDLNPQVAAVLVAPRPQWQPLTLMGNGFFHIAFGTIVGITAWTRGAAQIADIQNGGQATTPTTGPQPYPFPYWPQPVPVPMPAPQPTPAPVPVQPQPQPQPVPIQPQPQPVPVQPQPQPAPQPAPQPMPAPVPQTPQDTPASGKVDNPDDDGDNNSDDKPDLPQ